MPNYKIVDAEQLNTDLKGIADSIRAKGGTSGQFSFPDGFKTAIRNIPQEGGTGSGIIDVTELPTSGIDENAVYRMKKNFIVRPTNVFIVLFQGVYFTIEQYFENQGIHPGTINLIPVEELPTSMEPSDILGFTIVNIYMNRTDGKCYVYITEYGVAMTVGYFFGDISFDRGTTENIIEETEAGFYTSFEDYVELSRYFVRENYEWKEITAYITTKNPYNFSVDSLVTGDITERMFGASMLLSRKDIKKICEEWFLKNDGSYVNEIQSYQFKDSSIKTAVIPSFITRIGNLAFQNSKSLETVTFKGTPDKTGLAGDIFSDCTNLTTINVPWSEEQVENSPWGAPSGVTINYNYAGGNDDITDDDIIVDIWPDGPDVPDVPDVGG